ncbi:MAG TPA: pilus assembly protein TadG-related protein [Propylenella sp.]
MRRPDLYLADRSGNAAIIFSLAIIPLLALGGGAVDLAHRHDVHGELQAAVDTAAIAAARVIQLGQQARDPDWEQMSADAEAAADRLLVASLSTLGEPDEPEIAIEVQGESVRISAGLDVKTSFLGLIGVDSLRAGALAQVNLPDPFMVEVALVLDYSGSMGDDDKYVRMTEAARTFTQRIENEGAEGSLVGIVPFSEYVYATVAGSDVRDGPASGSVTTCLSNRDYPYSVTDAPPSTGMPASQWPEGDSAKCEDYSDDNVILHDLTDDFAALDAALAGMEPLGLTNIALAAEMGWHLLSPGPPFETARDFSEEDIQKVLILLTDGMQTVEAMGPGGEVSTVAADEATAEVCQAAKGQGIRIFSIAYDVDDERVHDLLSNCASSAEAYFEPAAGDISAVFEDIYAQMVESVWLSR